MKKLFTILTLLCAATGSWCKTADSLKGAQYYALGRAAFGNADYEAALSNLTTFKKLNAARLERQYAFAYTKVEQTISVCLEEIGELPHSAANSMAKPDSMLRTAKYRLALPPAELLEALGNTSDSGNAISQFVGDSSTKYFYLALIERERKNGGGALAHFEQAVRLDSSNGAAALELAVSRGLIAKSALGQSVTFSEAGRSATKSDTQIVISAYLGLANKHLFEKKYAEAWRYYEKAAKIDAQNIEAQTGIAEACGKMNRTAPAMKAMEAIAAIRPTDYGNQWKLACMYYNYGQYDKVVAMVPVLRSKIADPKGWAFMLGKAHQARNNYGKAIECFQQTIKDEPANSEAPYQIARMLVQMENYKGAIGYYHKALATDSGGFPNRMYELALALSADRQFSESIACFKKAFNGGYKAGRDFYTNMVNTMADADKPSEAIVTLQEMLVTRPTDISLITALGDLHYKGGNYKEAIATWNRIMATDDKNARLLYRIGQAYIKMGKSKEGRTLCSEAISIDPSLAPSAD